MTPMDFGETRVEGEFLAEEVSQHWDVDWQRETLSHQKQHHEKCRLYQR